MDKQKQIEEMARVICGFARDYENCDICPFNCINAPCEHHDYAINLINAGYCKISDGAVVLTGKEYKRYERIEKIIKLAKRERANGYEVKNGKLYYFSNMLDGFEYEFKDLQEICDAANHYNEEFFGLDQRLAFWKGKAEEAYTEAVMKFAEMLKSKCKELQDKYSHICKNKIEVIQETCRYEGVTAVKNSIDEIANELREGGEDEKCKL